MKGVVQDVELEVHGIKMRNDFHVAEKTTCDILLGAPWLRKTRAKMEWQGNKQVCVISSPSGEETASFIVARSGGPGLKGIGPIYHTQLPGLEIPNKHEHGVELARVYLQEEDDDSTRHGKEKVSVGDNNYVIGETCMACPVYPVQVCDVPQSSENVVGRSTCIIDSGDETEQSLGEPCTEHPLQFCWQAQNVTSPVYLESSTNMVGKINGVSCIISLNRNHTDNVISYQFARRIGAEIVQPEPPNPLVQIIRPTYCPPHKEFPVTQVSFELGGCSCSVWCFVRDLRYCDVVFGGLM